MKKEIKERLYNEIKEIINNYNLHILEFNFDSTLKEIKEIENKINTIIEIKHDNIHNIIESKQENKKESIIKIHEKYDDDLKKLHNEKELLTLINKTYKKIIENGLFLILNEFINLIINNCKNTRDLNEFFKFFEYNREKQEYNLKYHFYYDSNKYFVISYDIPKQCIYKKFYNDLYLNYYIDINNNYVWETKYYNYEENKKSK